MRKATAVGLLFVAAAGVGAREAGIVNYLPRNSQGTIDNVAAFHPEKAKASEQAVGRFIGGLLRKHNTGSDVSSAMSGSVAPAADVGKALLRLQSGAAQQCPTAKQSEYVVQVFKGQPDSVLCLRTDTAKQGADGTVTFDVELAKDYPYLVNLACSLSGATAAQHQFMDTRLQAYGNHLLQQTGVIPAGEHAAVAVEVAQTPNSSCAPQPQPSP